MGQKGYAFPTLVNNFSGPAFNSPEEWMNQCLILLQRITLKTSQCYCASYYFNDIYYWVFKIA